MEPQSKVRKKVKRPGGRNPGSRRKSKCWRWARKIKRSQSQGVAGGAKAWPRPSTGDALEEEQQQQQQQEHSEEEDRKTQGSKRRDRKRGSEAELQDRGQTGNRVGTSCPFVVVVKHRRY
ncbi:hypothetical protein FVEG_14741 [Fusarium verticillioides 7600]|uniref:Uncharacterized protein n=1 Tax=Gibberella moniliformis (strain M3125 / FGSC 7600) TaxID=334819 RepID=W7LNG5_GIBM7|nr:hypothetical protein FVEG_14741 [Fusarium verticillioides 7600]EWG37025.1 hypothetical protein FVEG_14741 [Fusarium verticillioides 7600]